jgi:hypothetical protein
MAKKGLSPTQRTLRALRNEGTICGIVEKFNPHVGEHGIRQDLFGFVDVVALAPNGIIGVQCCAGSGHAAHRTKIVENEVAPEWLKSGGRIQIWSWSKKKLKRGGKAERWMPRMEELTAADLITPTTQGE